MIESNSGKIFRFKLDHQLGYGFAEVYDFTDESMFDGNVVYVYNKVDAVDQKVYSLEEITSSDFALGPIRLHKYPATRGLYAWRYLFQNQKFFITELPPHKDQRGLPTDDNWDNLDGWYLRNGVGSSAPPIVDYAKVRHFETTILNPPAGVVSKFSMKVLIDNQKNVSDYYDFSNLGTKNMFVQLVNTYYSLPEAEELLKQIPPSI